MFDEIIIKRKLKKELTGEIYSTLSYDIQTDLRIMEHLIKCDPKAISLIPSTQDVSVYVLENYDLIHYLTPEQLNESIEELDISKINLTKELFEKMNSDNQTKVFKIFPIKCMEYFDTRKRDEAIIGVILAKYASSEHEVFENEYQNKYSSCKDFPDDELIKIILNLSQEEFYNLFYGQNVTSLYWGKSVMRKYIIDYFLSLDDKALEDKFDLLKKLYEDLPEKLKNIIDLKEAGDNLDKIVQLPDDLQVKYFLKNINKLNYASSEIMERTLMEYEELTADLLLKYKLLYSEELLCLLSKVEQEKVFSRNFYQVYKHTYTIEPKFNLDTIMYNKLSQISDIEKRNKLLDLYKSLDEEEFLFLDEYAIYNRQKYQISRLLYERNIVNNNNAELLIKYKETCDRNLLIEILANAYGEHVLEIFRDRPKLDLLDISNFKLFDRRIYEKLGKNFIHHFLNCQTFILDDFIGKLAEEETALNSFANYFCYIINNLENVDINTITNLIEKFIVHEEVINKIDFNNINETTKNNLMLLINDSKMLSIGVHSITDLNNYIEIRKKRYIEIVNEATDQSEIKNIIFSYVFGRSVSQDYIFCSFGDQLEKLSFDKALRIFNVDKIVSNQEIIDKMGLTQDEINMLILLHEINLQEDMNVLRNTCISLINRNLDTVLLANTFDKIKNFYIEDIRKGLLSSSMLEKKKKTNVEGIEIVQFAGEEFTLICSSTGQNLSKPNDGKDEKSGHALLNDWLTREEGVNMISTALVSSDTNIYPVAERIWQRISDSIILVFDNDISVIGMGASDIESEKDERNVMHTFDLIGVSDRDHGFSTMTELKNRINRNNYRKRKTYCQDDKFESEITIARREEDIRKTGGGLKRTMPIAMYVIGEITPKHIETAKVFNEYYEKNGLGKFRIIQVDPKFYKGEGIIVTSEFMEIGDGPSGRSIR